MPSLANTFVKLATVTVGLLAAPAFGHLHFHIASEQSTSWPKILASIGLTPAVDPAQAGEGISSLVVFPLGSPGNATALIKQLDAGALMVVEGNHPLSAALGIQPTSELILARSVEDQFAQGLPIVWEKPASLPRYQLPAGAKVYAREKWTDAPLVVGLRRGKGALLWLATSPGSKGYDRFPYLLQALTDLGLEAPFRARNLWAFFDSSYRLRVDPDYFAARWRQAGISALHIASWHYYEPDAQRDEYLRKLIAACHKRAILVYAWVELPHVSEAFWNAHPEWREQTALLQDAHLDWRKLMNLNNPDCARTVKAGITRLLTAFDWDGVNLAELYFESLEGLSNPARFTPFNADVRKEFQALHGVDPVEVARTGNHPLQPKLLDFRAMLAKRLQEEWLAFLEQQRRPKPHLDIVLTHVDDRFDNRMRDLIGADASRLLPLLDRHDFTFLIEDPATIWHLGPQRYPQIADRYRAITPKPEKLAIDINIVERYQDVYPTKQQTGTELFQLVQLSTKAFARVALYFENSILKQDLHLLPASNALVHSAKAAGRRLAVDSPRGVGIPGRDPVLVDGQPWPFHDGQVAWLPPGPHVIEPLGEKQPPAAHILDCNCSLETVRPRGSAIDLTYHNSHRAIVLLDRAPKRVEIDGAPAEVELSTQLRLPRGQHLVTLEF